MTAVPLLVVFFFGVSLGAFVTARLFRRILRRTNEDHRTLYEGLSNTYRAETTYFVQQIRIIAEAMKSGDRAELLRLVEQLGRVVTPK